MLKGTHNAGHSFVCSAVSCDLTSVPTPPTATPFSRWANRGLGREPDASKFPENQLESGFILFWLGKKRPVRLGLCWRLHFFCQASVAHACNPSYQGGLRSGGL
jgi:hypothetical protein